MSKEYYFAYHTVWAALIITHIDSTHPTTQMVLICCLCYAEIVFLMKFMITDLFYFMICRSNSISTRTSGENITFHGFNIWNHKCYYKAPKPTWNLAQWTLWRIHRFINRNNLWLDKHTIYVWNVKSALLIALPKPTSPLLYHIHATYV